MKLPAIVCISLFALIAACGDNRSDANPSTNPAPSNTNPSTHPNNPSTPNPQTQNQDQDLSTRVRRAIDDDTALAPMAQDLQVTATNGTVTLRGSVASQSDKDAIGNKAKGVAGVQNVVNNLTVKG